MAIASVAHTFVFSAKQYHYMSVHEYGKLSLQKTKEVVEVDEENPKPTRIEKMETQVEAAGTSVKESVQDIVVEGGQHVSSLFKPSLNPLMRR